LKKKSPEEKNQLSKNNEEEIAFEEVRVVRLVNQEIQFFLSILRRVFYKTLRREIFTSYKEQEVFFPVLNKNQQSKDQNRTFMFSILILYVLRLKKCIYMVSIFAFKMHMYIRYIWLYISPEKLTQKRA